MHAPAVGHDTAVNLSDALLRGLGVVCMVQRAPFQRSANVTVTPVRLVDSPTAVHAPPEAHATPDSLLKPRPGGLGTVWIAHRLPFHRSANGACPPSTSV
jgi:hypothetical protein